MSEEKPIKHADLAHHWGCSPANVSNLVNRHEMPEFTSLAAADAWRAVHAPARKPRKTSPKIGPEVGQKYGGSFGTTTHTSQQPPAGTGDGKGFKLHDDPSGDPSAAENRAAARRALGMRSGDAVPPERIDVDAFVDKQGDFSARMIEHAKEVPQIAHGLLKRAMTKGEPGAIAAASKNWHEASAHAADVLERFIAIQEKTGSLLTIDDVADVLLTELQEVRKNFKRLGLRHAALANPGDPSLAQRIFDEAVDVALAPADAAIDRVRSELAPAAEEATPSA